MTSKSEKSAGFTIVELMIATMVFSTILVAITIGVLYFTRAYYKGVYASTTQNAARNVTESIAKAIQFGSSDDIVKQPQQASDGKWYMCAGGYAFVYDFNGIYKTDGTGSSIGVYMQPISGSSCDVPSGITGQQQLLGDNMRITDLQVSEIAPYTISVTVAHDVAGATDQNTSLTALTGSDVACKTGSGSEYCAVSTVTATVSPRVAD